MFSGTDKLTVFLHSRSIPISKLFGGSERFGERTGLPSVGKMPARPQLRATLRPEWHRDHSSPHASSCHAPRRAPVIVLRKASTP